LEDPVKVYISSTLALYHHRFHLEEVEPPLLLRLSLDEKEIALDASKIVLL
jgi:hypothetical protein